MMYIIDLDYRWGRKEKKAFSWVGVYGDFNYLCKRNNLSD